MPIEFKKKSAKSAPAATSAADDDTPPFALKDADESTPAPEPAEAEPTKPAKKATKKVTKKAAAKGSPELSSALDTLSKIEHVQPKATIIVKHGTGAETTEEEPVGGVIVKAEPMANVGLSVGATVNLGNFNNAKFSVSLFMPSKIDPESLDATFKAVNDWVEAKAQLLHSELAGDEVDGD